MVFYLKTRPDDDNHNPQGPHNRQPGSINSANAKEKEISAILVSNH